MILGCFVIGCAVIFDCVVIGCAPCAGPAGSVDGAGEAVHLPGKQPELPGALQHPAPGQQSDPVSQPCL